MTTDEIARALVKGLVWRDTKSTDQRHEASIFEAMYEVSFDGEDWSFWNDGDEGYGPYPTLAAAQAAAEADYRARIAAALNLDLVAQLVEAASFLTWFKCKGSIGDALEAWEKLDTALDTIRGRT